MGRFYTREQLIAERAEWSRAGKKVVFTNGCYDVLHPGHIRLLEAARSLGDVLILALNTDSSVQRLKGPNRPLISQDQRAELALSLIHISRVHESISSLGPDQLLPAKSGPSFLAHDHW